MRESDCLGTKGEFWKQTGLQPLANLTQEFPHELVHLIPVRVLVVSRRVSVTAFLFGDPLHPSTGRCGEVETVFADLRLCPFPALSEL